MFNIVSKISAKKQNIIFIVFVFLLAILFETFQQLYYIKRFNLAENIQFLEVLKSQSYKWLVWVLLSFFLIIYTKKQSAKKEHITIDYLKYVLVIFGLVFLCVFIISVIQFIIIDDSFSLSKLFNEYVTFFTFQKAPIYTLGYIAIAVILHFYFTNQQLQIEVEALSELKKTNLNLYKELSKQNDDKTSVLNIKIGNNRKIIPVKDICWIEADDYCVIVHTNKEFAYTMRISLKALENKLASNFLRVHRKAIVNMNVVKELKLSQTPKILLENNLEIPVSKSNLKTVKDFLN